MYADIPFEVLLKTKKRLNTLPSVFKNRNQYLNIFMYTFYSFSKNSKILIPLIVYQSFQGPAKHGGPKPVFYWTAFWSRMSSDSSPDKTGN